MAQSAAQRHAARRHRGIRNALWRWLHTAGTMRSRGVGTHRPLSLGQPPLWGWQGAPAVPSCPRHGGMYLAAVLRWARAACVIGGEDECCHGRLAILRCGSLRWCGAGVGGDGWWRRCREAWQGSWGHLQDFRGWGEPWLALTAVHLGDTALTVWLRGGLPLPRPRVLPSVCAKEKQQG